MKKLLLALAFLFAAVPAFASETSALDRYQDLVADFYYVPPPAAQCLTTYFWCWMAVPVPAGTPCVCGTVYGPVNGIAGFAY